MRSSTTILVSLVGLMLVACSDGDDESLASATTMQPASTEEDNRNAVERCSGDFTCTAMGRSMDTTLKRVGGECVAGGFTLRSDGAATSSELSGARWTSNNPYTFSICLDEVCLPCFPKK